MATPSAYTRAFKILFFSTDMPALYPTKAKWIPYDANVIYPPESNFPSTTVYTLGEESTRFHPLTYEDNCNANDR